MSWGWTLLGTFGQLLLAGFMFMLAVFSAGGLVAGAPLGKFASGILDLSIYLLPALCLLSAGIVIYLNLRGASAMSYGWYVLPLAAAIAYLAYAVLLSRRS